MCMYTTFYLLSHAIHVVNAEIFIIPIIPYVTVNAQIFIILIIPCVSAQIFRLFSNHSIHLKSSATLTYNYLVHHVLPLLNLNLSRKFTSFGWFSRFALLFTLCLFKPDGLQLLPGVLPAKMTTVQFSSMQ